ncbi:glycosyltransferase involved in cell wall biosynthesis [Krasilnikovia cinnamomea]|uniref:Glycosyltransferase involved in cell wall biosynthesis n=1 Tax=Krasilnikovia cinnamomea TaxID=349313 RepID=A0A4Q7ZN02_9ACTN|nr:glycosyltransferase family 4 protein [Krasilnikovia cinnamomea]RZU52402.1 glycosyltransferase involved in cell wall biosynthesis [Krasilnikovia cinnamomea]
MAIDDVAGAGHRGRVVMLVDNGVKGDSRVQKTARSAAEAGWDVILLGRSSNASPHTWSLGAAQVRLLPVPRTPNVGARACRRRLLRSPLAYPPTGIAECRVRQVGAWKADITIRRAVGIAEGTHSGARRALLGAETRLARIAGRWVAYRQGQLIRAQTRLADFDTPKGRLYTAFWLRLLGDRAWRMLEPRLWDFELTYGPVIDKLKPDLIHANDFAMLGVGARAKIRARAKGRSVKLVWDAHEYLAGLLPRRNDHRWLPANLSAEREYVPYADATITVSTGLAELLQQQYQLPQLPAVVLNAPAQDHVPPGDHEVPDLRARCRVGPDTPLLVYSGAAAAQRGLRVMVEALPELDGAHVAFVVSNRTSPFIATLRQRAGELGVADRVHVLSYVPHWHVVRLLSGADVGVIPIHHCANHEIALITKYFEYSHARLPIVVSDMRVMAETTRQTGNGEVFRAEDVADFTRAVRAVLADPARYRAAYDRPGLLENWTWQAQARVLDEVYERVVPRDATAAPAARTGRADAPAQSLA